MDPRIDHKYIRGFGGVCTFWKKSISNHVKIIDTDNSRICTIEIKTKGSPLCIINVYMPSKTSDGDSEYKNTLAQIREIILTYKPTHRVVLCDDMNASLNRDNQRDKTFQNFIIDTKLKTDRTISEENTFFHHNNKFVSQIDYILVDNEQDGIKVHIHEMHPTNTSDHTLLTMAVVAEISTSMAKSKQNKQFKTKPQWHKADIDRYKAEIRENLPELHNVSTVREKVTKLVETLHKAGKKSIPSYMKLKQSKTKGKGIWNKRISNASKEAKLSFKKWKDSGRKDENLKTQVRQNKKKLRQIQRQSIADIRNKENERLMATSTSDNKTFFNLIRKQRKSQNENTQILWVNEQEITDKEEILDEWKNHFQDLATPKEEHTVNEKSRIIKLQNILIEEKELKEGSEIQPTNFNEIREAIRSMNSGKAADLEGISAEHLKYAQNEVSPILVEIINCIFKEADLPDELKKGVLTPVLKKSKDKRIPSNYRGIVVTNCIAKVLESILKNRIDSIFDPQQNCLQRGFTSKSSSLNAAYIITESINHHKAVKTPLILVSLDAQKAFDTVNHEILFNKLYHYGVQGKLWILMRNLYRRSCMTVKWEELFSDDIYLLQGTKQGSKLSTTLYKCYHNTTLELIKNSGLGAKVETISVATPTCADDTALLATNKSEMQAMLNIIEFSTQRDLITINAEKSEKLTYGKNTDSKVSLQNEEIIEKDSIKHLGINRNKRNSLDTENRIKIARQTIYALLGPGLVARKGLSPITALKLWKTFVIPRALYGIEVLEYTQTDIIRLEKLQLGICKHLQGLPERTASIAVYFMLGVEPVESVIDRNTLALFLNISRLPGSTENKLLRVAIKNKSSKSLANRVKVILEKYSLGTVEELFNNPPEKCTWKKRVQEAITTFWTTKWQLEKEDKNSLKYLHIQEQPSLNPHNVWACTRPIPQEVRKAELKTRLVTGTYLLQTNVARFNQQEVPATCKICRQEDETLGHFILQCPAYTTERETLFKFLQDIIDTKSNNTWTEILEQNLILQIVMDCTHPTITNRIGTSPEKLKAIERGTQVFCYKIHLKRAKQLALGNSS